MKTKQAQPFLKWAGGKTQLLEQIKLFFPNELSTGLITQYIEPFVGGGAVFFQVANLYPVPEFVSTYAKLIAYLIPKLSNTFSKYLIRLFQLL